MREAPEVRAATAADVRAVVETIAVAFERDPVAVWVIPDDARRLEVFGRFVEALVRGLYLPLGLVRWTGDGAGAALWFPPDAPEQDPEARAALAERVAEAWGEFADRGAALDAAIREHYPEVPHYYLSFVGVRPQGQGRGIGSTLLRDVLDRADRDGVPSYLEGSSERGLALYERHGFERRGKVVLPDGPALYPMWREPQGGSGGEPAPGPRTQS